MIERVWWLVGNLKKEWVFYVKVVDIEWDEWFFLFMKGKFED